MLREATRREIALPEDVSRTVLGPPSSPTSQIAKDRPLNRSIAQAFVCPKSILGTRERRKREACVFLLKYASSISERVFLLQAVTWPIASDRATTRAHTCRDAQVWKSGLEERIKKSARARRASSSWCSRARTLSNLDGTLP